MRQKRSFKESLKFRGRKFVISLKRNYYIIPLILVLVCATQFLCSLYILSPMFARIPKTYGEYNCIFLFIITLLCILYCVAYLNYALKKYGKKRPIYMLILYFAMWLINIVLLFVVLQANNSDLLEEIRDYTAATSDSEKVIYLKYILLGKQSQNCLITQIVLAIISFIFVLTAPLVQRLILKISFKPLEHHEKEE